MRDEKTMLELIISTAQKDERVRAVIMNGSRVNPNAVQDFFRDYDIVYIVTEIQLFKQNPAWIDIFGERMILQMPDDMESPIALERLGYAYLIQFMDGNRMDLTLFPKDKLSELEEDSLSLLLLDKDNLIASYPPASEASYLPTHPTEKAFSDCCNEFWWCSSYVAKGLWRDEIILAKYMQNVLEEELYKMLVWYIGIKSNCKINPGKHGSRFKKYLEPELWSLLLKTYSDADYEHTWDALIAMGSLFRKTAIAVAEQFTFSYPQEEDTKVSKHVEHVRQLPKDAGEMY